MSRNDEQETSARTAQATPCAGTPVPGGSKPDGDESFPYCLTIGEVFDGPFDVLLALIKRQHLDVTNLPLGLITAQFQTYAKNIDVTEVERAAEFIYVAAQLIQIKARMLLPVDRPIDGDSPTDPRKELVDRLINYEQLKLAAMALHEMQLVTATTVTNPGIRDFLDEVDLFAPVAGHSLGEAELISAYKSALERAISQPENEIDPELITVERMLEFFRESLSEMNGPITFDEAILGSRDPAKVAVGVLALLEMVRVGAVVLRQDQMFGQVFIKKTASFDQAMDGHVATE